MSEIIYRNLVSLTCINKMTQEQSVLNRGFDNAAEATYDYMQQCGKYISDGCTHLLNERDNNGFMRDVYEDKLFTYDIVLELNK